MERKPPNIDFQKSRPEATEEKETKWWNRKIPQPWLTICWLIALIVLMLYGYALSLAL